MTVIDFTELLDSEGCPDCGAEAYIEATPEGYMRMRYRCEHSQWDGHDDATE